MEERTERQPAGANGALARCACGEPITRPGAAQCFACWKRRPKAAAAPVSDEPCRGCGAALPFGPLRFCDACRARLFHATPEVV